MPDPAIEIAEFASLEALPPDALGLFGRNSPFSTLPWYRASTAHALPRGAAAAFLLARQGGQTLAVIPMRRGPGRTFASLTTPYTALWQPLLPDTPTAPLPAIAKMLVQLCRKFPITGFDALDAASPLLLALRQAAAEAGLHVLAFDHFCNWHLRLLPGATWPDYLAARPATLRETIRRRSKHLISKLGVRFSIVEGPQDLDAAIADYENIYASSWKQPEPFENFAAALMREAATSGMLRLTRLHLADEPIAAQLWLVHERCAHVLKLAHTEAHRALSPGTVLTALTIEHLLSGKIADELDFGRGDDPYKKLWTGVRRQRVGLLLANPRTLPGNAAIARHATSRFLKSLGLQG